MDGREFVNKAGTQQREISADHDSDGPYRLSMSNTFPGKTRFFAEKSVSIVIIGGPMSGGALVTFDRGAFARISNDDFFNLDPNVELTEAEFRARVGTDVLDKWFANEPNPVREFLEDLNELGEYAELGMPRSFIEKLAPETRRKLLETRREIAEEREAEGTWISTDDWNEVVESRPRT